jgi:hypothetical protein
LKTGTKADDDVENNPKNDNLLNDLKNLKNLGDNLKNLTEKKRKN